jgi:hypothetical protein
MIPDKRPRKVVLGLAAPLVVALSCGGGGAKPDGGGASGIGFGGSRDGGGSGGVTGAGGATGLPACLVAQEAPSFTDCSDFDGTGDWVAPARAVLGDGGIYLPGGEMVTPMGGRIASGDYDLVKAWWGSSATPTRRTMRVFDNGAYIAWVADNDESNRDAGIMHFRANTTATVANAVIQVDQVNCGSISSYSYTVSGEQLLLFNLSSNALFTYQQRCAR